MKKYYQGIGQLKIYNGGKTITLWCPRHQIREYLKHNEFKLLDWNGRRYDFKNYNLLLN